MGSYHRFPKSSPAAELARRRDQDWREAEFRKALRTQPKPAARLDMSRRVFDRSALAELMAWPDRRTLH